MQKSKLTYDEDLSAHMNAPVLVTDCAAMYRRRIKGNTPPYDATVLKLNNALVDEWETQVLQKLADKNGRVPASKVHFTWSVFAEGKELWTRQEHLLYIPEIPDSTANYWVTFFKEKSVEQLHATSMGLVYYGWTLFTTAIRQYFIREKWEKIYSKSKDPLEWIKVANSFGPLMNQTKLPFDTTKEMYDEMYEKFAAVMRYRIEPERV